MIVRNFIAVLTFGLLSLNAVATISEEQLSARLNELEKISVLDYAALKRQASYELRNMSIEERAFAEATKLLEELRFAVVRGHEMALSELGDVNAARSQLRANMEKDIHLIDESLRDDVRQIVEDVLQSSTPQSIKPHPSDRLVQSMKVRAAQMQTLLTQAPHEVVVTNEKLSDARPIRELSPERFGEIDHESKAALLQALVDDQSQSERWVSTSNITARSANQRGYETEFSAQVSAEFMGVKVAAGPTFKFKKYVTTSVDLKGEGLYPLFDAQGKFDLVLRDAAGNPRKIDGKTARRLIFFTCEVETEVESEIAAGGGFKVAGLGAEGKVVAKYSTSISSNSRRALVPSTVDGRQVILSTLAEICHRDFMNTKISNGKTVLQNQEVMVKNIASGLTYVNPAMKCVNDNHCVNWFNREVIWLHKINTTPRCVQDKSSPNLMTCQVRGVAKAACSVYKEGKRVSTGMFEYTCDTGFKCVITHEGGWLQNWELWDPWRAECRKN